MTGVTLMLGNLAKQACFRFGLESYEFYCHSSIVPLFNERQLGGGRFPYTEPALEYPVGIGLVVWLESLVSSSAVGFWLVNVWLLSMVTLITVAVLWSLAGARSLLFAAAPTLVLYVFLNWDVLAVSCVVGAIALFLRRRDVPAAILIGVGAAIKIFPGLLVVPFLADRLREGDRFSAVRLPLVMAATLVALNLPVAVFAFDGWAHFFRFSSSRAAEWGALWNAACETFGSRLCANVPLVNALSLAAFIAASAFTWVVATRLAPLMPRWQLGFPLTVIFLLTNKVYSPQYSLWILPWFPLVLPDLRWFVAFEIIDIGIYITSFAWQQELAGLSGGLPLWPQNVFVVVRAALLLAMILVFVRRGSSRALLIHPSNAARGPHQQDRDRKTPPASHGVLLR